MMSENDKINMQEPPFFSIIIPVYNVEKYLKDCLDSVISQTFLDYEVILIDDGSRDMSGKICDKYVANNIGIRVYHKENQGLLATRCYGAERAIGKYIVSLDSDDMLRSDALEKIYEVIMKFDADMVIFNASREENYQKNYKTLGISSEKILEKEDLYKLICEGPALNNMCLKTFRREYAVCTYQMQSYFSVKNGEDLLQSLEPISRAERVIYLNENLYFYRDNNTSITRTFQDDYYHSISLAGMVLREYAERWDNVMNTGTKWRKMVYDRNLKTCAAAIRYYNSSDSFEKRMNLLKEIYQDDFFMTSYQYGSRKTLNMIEKIEIILLKRKRFRLLNMFGIVFRCKRCCR